MNKQNLKETNDLVDLNFGSSVNHSLDLKREVSDLTVYKNMDENLMKRKLTLNREASTNSFFSFKPMILSRNSSETDWYTTMKNKERFDISLNDFKKCFSKQKKKSCEIDLTTNEKILFNKIIESGGFHSICSKPKIENPNPFTSISTTESVSKLFDQFKGISD